MAKKMRGGQKRMVTEVAKERVELLLELAKHKYIEGDENLAKRYSQLARKIQLRYRIRNKEYLKKYCKKCFIPWIKGKTVSVRVNSQSAFVEWTCVCGYKKKIKRYKK
jgi:ribonuclease P protein subunit RPR2